MGDVIGKHIDELLTWFKKNYKRPKLWIGLGVVIFCLVLLFPYIDSNFFYFTRIEKRIDILERVIELDEEKINKNEMYKEEYQSILEEIEQQDERSVNSVMNRIITYINKMTVAGIEQGNVWIKFFTGAIWFLMVTLCIPFMKIEKRSDKILSFILMLIISIVIGSFFSIIPIIINPMVNYLGIPILQIILIFTFLCKL